MQNVTYNSLPSVVSQLFEKIVNIEKLLVEQNEPVSDQPTDELLNVEQAAELLQLKVPTMYSKVSRNELPVMKRGKRLYFSKAELTAYLKAGRIKTNEELEAEAETYLSNHKKRSNHAK
jgi:excisionase family DNA binding protein